MDEKTNGDCKSDNISIYNTAIVELLIANSRCIFI